MMRQRGFTLVEIAIVLVVIGLLLGGVLKGQEIIKNAKINSLQNTIKELTTAIATYQDRYRAFPGDDKDAASHLGDPNIQGGNGNGYLDGWWGEQNNDQAETRLFWLHLRRAGIIAGEGTAQPSHAFGAIMGVQGAGAYGMVGPVLCFGRLQGDAARILDDKLDDGAPTTGTVRGGYSGAAYQDDRTYDVCIRI